MSRSLLGIAELEGEVDEPLDLLPVEPAGGGGHRPIPLPDALAHRRAVAAPHHRRGEQIEVRVEGEVVALPLPPLAVAAGAVGGVELRRGQVLARASDPEQGPEQGPKQGDEEQQGRPGAQVCGFAGPRRCTMVEVAWSRGRTTISSMLTWDGRVATQAIQSAMSSAVSGCRPR